MKIKTVCTRGISLVMEQKEGFRGFVFESMNRFLSGDFGECKDPELNTETDKLGVYSMENRDFIIWIKQDYDVITVLFPSEY